MKKVKVTFVKRLLLRSWLLRVLLSHALASYVSWPIHLLVHYLVFGEVTYPLKYLLLAPYYVPGIMVYFAVSFLLRFPFFDIMPPLSPTISLWLSYILVFPASLCVTFMWAARAKRKLAEGGMDTQQLSAL